jgi:hypothetical protein
MMKVGEDSINKELVRECKMSAGNLKRKNSFGDFCVVGQKY